ncbi:DNA-binding winged helix-turn-helix (wHTH) protein [Vibrio crassostreae]|uniref:winged helix-turn-helix domain-containing protein n=1 Tax=Vibrio crassostreae TaxID=246167 RepID=UPI0006311554|nr:winged helix-turn-helix domain-containing protein [Vibrio crassostreae]ROO76047.1 DNA-binding winged helix-turn-helix (wHTH) protein [Vibrio crassostreae]ROP14057.1 DNA-binding winged helix-turn-helix (wHTH) protein [Vibrio crassostreae]ROQ88142.1 DNA-binding winged helix-turn-helix (wHTH) protein [Vibrio crassostreae]ROS70957.1 DNA-binding winged helix-turn-helix (wHTH) protein [Vibrio crassostreae]RPE94709.1 DNA-binding winged helix-turn-helix (wHTH) protein [Vibrio crassostreae]
MFKRLSIDTVRRTITLIDSDSGQENQPLELNRSEYNLLLAFCESHGEVIDKQALIEKGWPGRVVGDNSLAVAIMKLRKKLDSLELGFEVNNLPGEGYVFINAMNIEIVHDESAANNEAIIESHESDLEKDTIQEPVSQVADDNLETPMTTQDSTVSSDSNVFQRWSKKPVVWEITIALFIGLIMFYFVYREAFECFECFGGGAGG